MTEFVSKKRYRAIIFSSATSIVAKFIGAAVGIITTPLVINYLGKEQYGLWIAVSSIITWLQLSDFGVSGGIVNVLAECKGKNDFQLANKCVSAALLFLIFVAVALLVVIIPIINFIPLNSILNLTNSNLKALSHHAFIIILLFFTAGIPLGVISNIFTAYQKIYILNWYRIIGSVLSLLSIYVGIKYKVSFLVLLIFISTPTVIVNILLWMHNSFTKDISINFKQIEISSVKRILQSCIPLFLFQIGALLVNQLTNVLLANRANLTMVADYSVLMKLYLLIFGLGVSISIPFYSPIREALEKKEIKWVRKAIFRAVSFRTLIVSLLSVPLVLFGSDIIFIWIKQPLSSKFGLSGWLLLSFCAILASISSTLSEILTVLDDIWFQIILVFISGLITFCGLFFLIEKWGLSGVFIVYILSTLLPIFVCYNRIIFNIKKASQNLVF